MLLKKLLRWAEHLFRMEDHRLPKTVLYGVLSSGYHNIETPEKQYKDYLKKSLSACHIDHHQWSTAAADREAWRHTIHQAVSSFESTCKGNLEDERRKRKNREVPAFNQDRTLTYQPLWSDLPVPYWTCQSSASLQTPWTMPATH